jgi:hypothetical protein
MFGAMLGGFRVLSTLYSVRYVTIRALGGGIHCPRPSGGGILLMWGGAGRAGRVARAGNRQGALAPQAGAGGTPRGEGRVAAISIRTPKHGRIR